MTKDFFETVEYNVRSNCNSNFHFDTLPWNVQVWVKEMCSVFEMKLDDLKQELEIKIDYDCK